MKKITSLLCLTLLLTQLQGVSAYASTRSAMATAGGNNEQLDKLHAIRDILRGEYKGLLQDMFKRQIDGYFYKRLEDFTQVASALSAQVAVESDELNRIETEWIDIKSRTQLNQAPLANAVRLRAMRDRAHYAQSLGTTVLADFDILTTAWKERCTKSTLEFPHRYFTPRTKLSLDHYKFEPKVGEFVVSVTMSGGESGGVSGGGMTGNNGGNLQSAIQTGDVSSGLTAAGSMLALNSYACGPLVAYCAVAGAVMALTGWVIGVTERANAIAAQLEAIEDIYKAQQNALNAVSDLAFGMVDDRCAINLPNQISKDGLEISQLFAELKNQVAATTEHAAQLHQTLSMEFELLRSSFLEDLNDQVDRAVAIEQNSYFAKVQSQFDAQLDRDTQTMKFIKEKVYPGVRELQDKNKTLRLSDEMKLNAQYDLWDRWIEGDLSFNSRTDFSFLPASAIEASSGSSSPTSGPPGSANTWDSFKANFEILMSSKLLTNPTGTGETL
ncbi:MAG: hypothetical protein H7222_12120 [Methylotenera sp.]|nr:hypothetical protein [Oligoflexia bacterium]